MAGGIDAIIGGNIRLQRALRGLSQTGLAEKPGVVFRQVQKYESGRNAVRPEKPKPPAESFGRSMNDRPAGVAIGCAAAFTPGRREAEKVKMLIRRSLTIEASLPQDQTRVSVRAMAAGQEQETEQAE